jgi:hypothetical protein
MGVEVRGLQHAAIHVQLHLPNADISPDGKVGCMYTQKQNMHGSSNSKCWV